MDDAASLNAVASQPSAAVGSSTCAPVMASRAPEMPTVMDTVEGLVNDPSVTTNRAGVRPRLAHGALASVTPASRTSSATGDCGPPLTRRG